MGSNEPHVRELAVNECWALLRTESVGRLAVWVDDHPDIFPLNYAVDHGTIVFRSGSGTKVSAALSDAPVALEVDGYETSSREAWSVVIKGRAEGIQEIDELMDTVDLPLFPWQGGAKNLFIRLVPTLVTGRRFPVADPTMWQTPFSNVRRSPSE
ncbi:pyridoxamine 5'-phosphate oxidase family protein [Rhodococcus opacus]|uniref:pyridoxamine 5'-phosphate oxidase family protein n=1 Tax=Rhodococcus opacus TaxID=37919 RepID=UPI0003088382|nr:pyridoxamine 5'-phosphate oxidase family protein [Rhodococcus opacus]MDX5962753.1 pyridoxamine 5'-phosphate oxidase family protein [Rhodococcus opacus]CAG7638281.1 hypothetical protein E143388_07981 [Rhodococcus opacus]